MSESIQDKNIIKRQLFVKRGVKKIESYRKDKLKGIKEERAMKWVLLFLLTIMISLSAEEGKIKKYQNKNLPKERIESLKAEKVCSFPSTIEIGNITLGEIEPNSIQRNSKGDLILYNDISKQLEIIDKNSKHIKSFLGRGKGPGEIQYFNGFFLGINDTIFVPASGNRKIIKFTPKGDFVKDIPLQETVPMKIKKCGDSYIGYGFTFTIESGNISRESILSLYDSKFNLIKNISFNKVEIKAKDGYDRFKGIYRFDTDDENKLIYIAIPSTDRYTIDLLNSDGEKIEEINRNYIRIKYTKEEIEKINKETKVIINGEIIKNTARFKPAIKNIFVSKSGKLWVENSIDTKRKEIPSYDVFENGKLITKVKKELVPENETILNRGGEIVTRDEDGSINIYEVK
ncbi:MAG: hypothetical protein CR982_00995 [Candidatus Cloacimonadota bacterium]|nr:MAG: hypothetical protein CR982_00995 [Candidatus Cloacimonadota bacterium]PIE77763.1 MAG: hypothetical protein CSA15_11255 [Candidatus Delongbacteria bacterium]